ncbi:hypothetical protein ILYODFUR_035482 [Ilyodon furcidens]|uniref:Ribosomal protein L30 n=1 Tax=Ilyodon furcidens TaxID=33524 RepID=A0ABV0T657_9TELE
MVQKTHFLSLSTHCYETEPQNLLMKVASLKHLFRVGTKTTTSENKRFRQRMKNNTIKSNQNGFSEEQPDYDVVLKFSVNNYFEKKQVPSFFRTFLSLSVVLKPKTHS